MSLEQVLYERLTGWPALAALVDTRIYRLRAPQGATVPFLVTRRITATRFDAMQQSAGVVKTRVQIDCFAATDDAVREIARAVVAAFDSWMAPAASPEIFGAFVEDDQDDYDDLTGLYRAIIDVTIGHREG